MRAPAGGCCYCCYCLLLLLLLLMMMTDVWGGECGVWVRVRWRGLGRWDERRVGGGLAGGGGLRLDASSRAVSRKEVRVQERVSGGRRAWCRGRDARASRLIFGTGLQNEQRILSSRSPNAIGRKVLLIDPGLFRSTAPTQHALGWERGGVAIRVARVGAAAEGGEQAEGETGAAGGERGAEH